MTIKAGSNISWLAPKSIKTKLLFCSVALGVVPMAIVGILCYRNSYQALHDLAGQRMQCMASDVDEAAKGTAEIAQNITSVSQAAQSTSEGAINCQQAAARMSKMADELQESGAGNSVHDEAAFRPLDELSQQTMAVSGIKRPRKKMRPVSITKAGQR